MACALVAPVIADYRNSATYWTARRNAIHATIYPTPFSGGVDVVESNWVGISPMPVGAASCTRYTVNDPGGRSGGSVAYTHLLIPSVTPINKCLVLLWGHESIIEDASVMLIAPAMLAAGWHVLMVCMPNYAYQPLQDVVISGSHVIGTKNAYHCPLNVAGPWAGASLVRLYTDHIRQSMNEITSSLGISDFYLAGHSGGGASAVLLAAVESRFKICHILQGGEYTTALTYGTSLDYEAWSGNDVNVGSWGTYKDAVVVCSAINGRKTVLHAADADAYYGDQHVQWEAWAAENSIWIGNVGSGSSLAFHRKTTGDHNVDATQAAWVCNYLLTNG